MALNEALHEAAPPAEGQPGGGADTAALLRVASMTQALLDEAHRATLDNAGRQRLSEIHTRAIGIVHDALAPALTDELDEFSLPFVNDEPTDAELRLAQAALIGWLNGVFLGIQASAYQQGVQRANLLQQLAQQQATAEDQRSGSYL